MPESKQLPTAKYVPTAVISVSADKTFTSIDANSYQYCTTTCNLTVPSDTTYSFSLGTEIEIEQDSTGVVTLVAASGCSIRKLGSTATTGHQLLSQYAIAVLKKVAANEWRISGELQ